jgi:uncharacterized protein (TIGR03032 family)
MNESRVADGETATPVAAPAASRTIDLEIDASANFASLLAANRLSVLVSTYDVGKVIILRAVGEALNVHFVSVGRAMGIAANASRLTVGSRDRILEFYNMPALLPKLPPSDAYPPVQDACYVLRNSHVTGDIDIHEMAFGGDTLWFANTRFSCLCTYDLVYSFQPRWRPPFVKGLSGDDRCHLNGLAMVNGVPRFVTAFGATDEPEGWRAERASGGVMIDVPTGEIVVRGMAMPHSPRVYGGHLWVLESGRGTLGRVDPHSGRVDTHGQFSGFTRGLDFHGPLAFVGLSQVRQSNVFGGLPLTERVPENERFCGLQVMNLTTGKQEAYLKFASGVHEVFAVHVLPGITFPQVLEQDDPLVPTTYALSPEALAVVRSS